MVIYEQGAQREYDRATTREKQLNLPHEVRGSGSAPCSTRHFTVPHAPFRIPNS